MKPEEKLQLDRVEQKLNAFLDVYYRTHFIDKDIFNNPVIFNNDVSFNGDGGTKIGGSTSSLIGFYDATPIAQQTAISSPSGGSTIDSEARTAINSIITKLQTLGLTA